MQIKRFSSLTERVSALWIINWLHAYRCAQSGKRSDIEHLKHILTLGVTNGILIKLRCNRCCPECACVCQYAWTYLRFLSVFKSIYSMRSHRTDRLCVRMESNRCSSMCRCLYDRMCYSNKSIWFSLFSNRVPSECINRYKLHWEQAVILMQKCHK